MHEEIELQTNSSNERININWDGEDTVFLAVDDVNAGIEVELTEQELEKLIDGLTLIHHEMQTTAD